MGEAGIGTVASGVAKGNADIIQVFKHDLYRYSPMIFCSPVSSLETKLFLLYLSIFITSQETVCATEYSKNSLDQYEQWDRNITATLFALSVLDAQFILKSFVKT